MSLLGEFVQRSLAPPNLVMLYLLAVIISASFWGRGPSVATAVLSVIAFDFLFVPPRFTLTVADTQYILTFIGLFIVGIVISELASKLRERAIEACSREAQTNVLYNLSRDLAGALSLENALQVILAHLKKVLGRDLSIHLQEGESIRTWSSRADGVEDRDVGAAVREALSEKSIIDRITRTSPSSGLGFVTLRTSGKTVGLLSYELRGQEKDPGLEKKRLLDAMASQAALALERIKLLEDNRQIELLHEKEILQTALLSSISHDLRTPLVSITGSLSSLLQKEKKLNSQVKRELVETAYAESVRMNRLVGHLLDMARLETGAQKVRLRPCDIGEIIGVALEELKDKLDSRSVRVDISEEIGDVLVDFFLLAKVLTNVIDNAIKYSPPNTVMEVTARIENGCLKIRVKDQGCGIPEADLERVFNKFYRVERSRKIQGTGLGLSICKGIVELHGGRIWVESVENKETTVTIELPPPQRKEGEP